MPPISRTIALTSMLLSLGACHAHFQANARTSTASGSQATASSNSNASAAAAAAPAAQGGTNNGSTANFRARGSAQGSLRVRAQGSGQGTGSAQPAATPASDATTARTVTAAPRPITFTAPPRPQIQPAQQPPVFRGRVMIASRRASRARGRTPTPPPVVTAPTPVTPPTTTAVTPPSTTPVAPPVFVEPPVIAAPEPAPPAPPAAPIPAPSTPPENVFGYDRPVLGCFEGQVYFIPDNSQRLPRKYNDLESSAVLYACEWDIPTRAWEQGFPGLSDRFEWFAIRYEGAFNITTAGNYRFRLSSDDGAKVTIDGRVVIDNDGVHAPEEKSGQAQLSAGDHTMVIEYFQGPRYHINLQLFVTPPDGQEGVFSVRPQ